jgi:predicted phage terminase large subunit-like protein
MGYEALSPEELVELEELLTAREQYAGATEEEKQRIQYRASLEANFSTFVKAAWHVIRPGVELKWSWHYDLISEHLTLVYERKCRRLRVNMPPRTLKSIMVTVMFPVWVWTKQSTHNFATASYSGELSTEHSVLRRNLIESDWFKGLWGDKVWLAEDQNQKAKYKNNSQAQMIATSVGGTATGLGGDTLILDDGMKPEEAPSEVIRASAHSWFDGTWSTRLNDPSTGAMIVVEQRTHELDISGTLSDGWTLLVLPLEAETEERWVFPISGRVIERRPGDILQPERFPAAVVENLKRKRLVWAGQYQQHPSPLEGNMIKRSEVRYYGGRDPITGAVDPPLPDRFDTVVISADCSFKDLKTSDYVCVGAIGAQGPNRYIFTVVLKHLDLPATGVEIKRQRATYGARTVLVEDKANGPAVIKELRREISGVVEINPEGGKVSRFFAMCGEWQAGNWFVDRTAAWTEPFVDSITKFPTGAYDDDCDMVSQAATWLQQNNQTYGLIDYMKQLDKEVMAKRMGKTKSATNGTKSNGSETKPLLPGTVPPGPETGDLAHKTNGTAHTDEKIAVDIPDNVDRCPECKSVLVQRVAGGKRCGQCGCQWGQARILQPDPSQVRK